jgi:hypothetical protein
MLTLVVWFHTVSIRYRLEYACGSSFGCSKHSPHVSYVYKFKKLSDYARVEKLIFEEAANFQQKNKCHSKTAYSLAIHKF